MGQALKKCIVDQLGFQELPYEHLQDSNKLVHNMLSLLSGPRRALVSKHLRFSVRDLERIRARCRSLYYVTSCRDMRERIWSRQKYRFKSGNVNSTLTEEEHSVAVEKMLRDTRNEPFLEAHPYLDRQERKIDIAEVDKLVPDYVVRNVDGLFGSDLEALLKALGCNEHFVTNNMHENEWDGEDVLRLLKLKLGNVIFRKLRMHGDRVNTGGLLRARRFVERARGDEFV